MSDRAAAPKYRRLADRWLGRIERGDWKPGQRLPSETALAADSGVALGTVQKALNHLAGQGVLQRRHGRGTFVSGPPAPERDLRHFRFLAEDGTSLLPVYPHVLDVARVDDDGPWSAFLGTEPFYVRIDRRIDIGTAAPRRGDFAVMAELYLPGRRFAALLDLGTADLDGILIRDLLDQRFDTPTLSVGHRLAVGRLPPRVCRHLHLAPDTAGATLILRGTTWRDQPASWQRIFIPPTDRLLQLPVAELGGRAG